MQVTRTSHTSGNFEFTVDGVKSDAYVRSVEGGWSHAELGTSGKTSRELEHITTVYLDPITFEFGAASSPDMLKWIQSSWSGQPVAPRHGQISYADFHMKTALEQEFHEAFLTETTFPTLDGSSKEGGYIKCKLLPSHSTVKWLGMPGPRLTSFTSPAQKMWTPSAFRLNILGVEGLEYTNKIDGFTVTTGMTKCTTGVDRLPEIQPCALRFPKLSGTISLRYAEQLLKWHQRYVRSADGQGTQDESAYRNGSIEFLTPDRKTTLFAIELERVAPLHVGMLPSKANEEQIRRLKFELYVKSMKIVGSSAMGFR